MANSSISPKLRSLGGDAARTPKDTGTHNLSSNVLSQNGYGILCTLCYTIVLPLQRVCAQAQVLARAISCKRKCWQGRFRASASACRGGFVQAQVLAGAISCKRKCLQGRFRASANACRGDFSHTGKHNAALNCAGRRDTSLLLVTLGDGHPGPPNLP